MLAINIQDDGKTGNLSKTRGHQTQGQIPTLTHEKTEPGYKTARPVQAILKLQLSKDFPTVGLSYPVY